MNKKQETDNLEQKSNYYKWLLNGKIEEIEQKEIISAFSGFLSIWNLDYHYNESYLPSYFDDFIEFSKYLKIRVQLLEHLILTDAFRNYFYRFNKNYSLDTSKQLKQLIINIDDVVSCSLNAYTSSKVEKFFKDNPLIKLNSSLYNKKISQNSFNISYRLSYCEGKNQTGDIHEEFQIYKNITQNFLSEADDIILGNSCFKKFTDHCKDLVFDKKKDKK